MRERTTTRWLAAAGVVGSSCGAPWGEGILDPTGGEVCLSERRVCIAVPIGAIAATETVRITQGGERPPAALSDVWEIAGTSRTPVQFLTPRRASVSFSMSIVDGGGVPNPTLLRVYTMEEGAWVPLANPHLDLVRGEIVGEVSHLSPFVVLRADRLPDGGMPPSVDWPTKDAGPSSLPFDGGFSHPDAGTSNVGGQDAGRADGGLPDAGRPDAGGVDAGPLDAGAPDAGPPDAGPLDAGVADAGAPDAGPPDAGVLDAGSPDAGEPSPDASVLDAGLDDAGVADAG